ncbi:DNA-3-methyladenine glycosylase 2 family protein [Candidatus Bathyarchaeota archaeon]|nr:DNA-3-methyladenine glycosylase 2 family protein [Candidatus Bathyarchaeota archaeon]
MSYTEKITVDALAPFSFDLSSEIFSNGDRQIRNYENGRLWQVIRVNSKLVLATVEAAGAVEKPKVSVELKSDSAITVEDKKQAEAAVNALFSLDLDLNPFYETVKADKVMAAITRKLWGLKSPSTPTVFEALVDAIVEQQISIKVANTIETRITKKFGDVLDLEGDVYYVHPTPQRLAAVSTEELRQCGLSFRKAEYIKGAATLIAEGKLDLENFRKYERSEQIIKELDEIRGIGVWTAEFTMLRGMQRLEALPADDLGLRRDISRYYRDGKVIQSAEARRIAEGWGRWKGLAAYYLVVASMLDVDV